MRPPACDPARDGRRRRGCPRGRGPARHARGGRGFALAGPAPDRRWAGGGARVGGRRPAPVSPARPCAGDPPAVARGSPGGAGPAPGGQAPRRREPLVGPAGQRRCVSRNAPRPPEADRRIRRCGIGRPLHRRVRPVAGFALRVPGRQDDRRGEARRLGHPISDACRGAQQGSVPAPAAGRASPGGRASCSSAVSPTGRTPTR